MAANYDTFYEILKSFLTGMSERFPENEGVKSGLNTVSMLDGQVSFYPTLVDKWMKFSEPIEAGIHTKNQEQVCEAFNHTNNKVILSMNVPSVMNSEETKQEVKDEVWRYMQTLTTLGRSLKTVEASMAISSQVQTQQEKPSEVPAEKPKAAPQKPDMSQIFGGVMDSVNKLLQDNSDNNPLGQLLKQALNPNQLQQGMAGNVAANMMENTPGSVMEEAAAKAGMGVDDIMYRLKRLETLEQKETLRKQRRGVTGRTAKHKR